MITRNVIMAMVPLVVLAGLASARTRAGGWLVAVICAAGVVAFAGVETTAADQRDDWRGVVDAIGPATVGPRALVVNPSDGPPALELYLPAHALPFGATSTIQTREIDVIDVARDAPTRPRRRSDGFTATVIHTSTYTLVRYLAAGPGDGVLQPARRPRAASGGRRERAGERLRALRRRGASCRRRPSGGSATRSPSAAPSRAARRLGVVADQVIDLGRAHQGVADGDVALDVEPPWSKAISTHSRTEWVTPVAMTKSSGTSCCSISHIAST